MATDTAADCAAAQPGVQSEAPGNVSAEPERPSPAASGPSTDAVKTKELITKPLTTPVVPAGKAVAMPSALSLFREPPLNIGTLPSVSKNGEGSSAGKAVAVPPATKRKTTDLNLKTVVIDPIYDLTVIVGTPNSADGQVAFQVNRGSLRHASDVWNKMLSGHWGEKLKDQSEIEFPDDPPWAFEQVLRIIHFQTEKLPSGVKYTDLKSLAILTDKYNLARVVRMPISFKKWLEPGLSIWHKWPAHASLQYGVYMAHAFQIQDDYDYLISKLAMEVQVDKTDAALYHATGENKTRLKADFPDRILLDIRGIRAIILGDWLRLCKTAFSESILHVSDGASNTCGKAICRATKIGILFSGLQAAGLYPFPENTQVMYESVAWYWKALNNIGSDFKDYKPCDGVKGYGYGNHHSSCSYEQCLGDFGLLTSAKATLVRKGHKDVVAHMLSGEFLEATV